MGSVLPTIIPIALDVVAGGKKESSQSRSAEIEKQQIVQSQQADEEKRQRALKAAMATRRARFGASGIETGDGSAEAVLLGMFSQSEDELNDRLQRDGLRLQAVDANSQAASSRNLLSLTNDVYSGAFSRTFLN